MFSNIKIKMILIGNMQTTLNNFGFILDTTKGNFRTYRMFHRFGVQILDMLNFVKLTHNGLVLGFGFSILPQKWFYQSGQKRLGNNHLA